MRYSSRCLLLLQLALQGFEDRIFVLNTAGWLTILYIYCADL